MSPTKSFQGHTGPVHDLCQISIGKFHLLLTGSSDLSVRVRFQLMIFSCGKEVLKNFSYGILLQANVYVHFYFRMKFIRYVHRHFPQRSTVVPMLEQSLLYHYGH